MKKYCAFMLYVALLFLPTVSSATDVPTYTVSTVYEAPENAALGQLVVKNDTLYVVRRDNSTLVQVLPDGTGTVFAGGAASPSLLVPSFLPDGPLTATEVSFGVLSNVAIDSKANLYAQVGKNTWRISPEGQLTLFAGKKAFTLPFDPLTGMDGPAIDAILPQPGGQGGAAIDGADNVFLRTSTAVPNIVKIDTTGLITLYAGNGERGNAGDGGQATLAELYGLGQIVADAAGNLYLAEADRGIRKIAADGTITTIVSNRDAATVVQRDGVIDNIGALEAKFDDILFLAVGPDGSVFFVHSAGSTVYQLTPDGHVSTIAGKEEGGFGGDGGPARDAQFKNIFGIAVDASGNVYVSDRNNLRIRKLTPDAASQAGGGDTGGTTGGGDTGGGQTGGGDTGSGGDTSTGGGDTTPSVDLPTGDRGPIALDLDETTGDQAKVQTDTNPASGDKVVIDIVAVSGASGNIGFQVVLAYDAAQLQFDGFAAKDLWAAGLPIVPPASGGEAQIQVALLGQTASSDVGSMGHATFTALDGFTGTAKVEIKSASYDNPVTVGSGGQFVVIGGAVVTIPSDPVEASDFSGDGTVDFSDFLTFAQNFGKSSSDSDFNTRIDLNQDGSVDFADFLAFAQQFGKSTGG